MTARRLAGAVLLALPLAILSGCVDGEAGRDPGPPSAQTSVQGIVQAADAGSFTSASFGGGSARAEASTDGYRVLAGVATAEACGGVLKDATLGAIRFVLDGGTRDIEDLGFSSKRKRKAIRRLCSAASYPTTIEIKRRAPADGGN